MKRNDIHINRELLNQIQDAKEVADIMNNTAIQDAIRIANNPEIQDAYQVADIIEKNIGIMDITSEFSRMRESAINCFNALLPDNFNDYFKQISYYISEMAQQIMPLYSHNLIIDTADLIKGIAENYDIIHYYPDNMSDEEASGNEEANNKIVTEIFNPEEETDNVIAKKGSAIITLSPVNYRVLKYLSENPEALHQLTSRKFEEVMAEIYCRLGYKVELTKATRDGGKDLIIRKPEILGDFIYYVECKQYSADKPVGVGIIRNLVGMINTDRVNGGILATTSYFTPDARRFVIDNKYDYQIQMHDYIKIRDMLNRVI